MIISQVSYRTNGPLVYSFESVKKLKVMHRSLIRIYPSDYELFSEPLLRHARNCFRQGHRGSFVLSFTICSSTVHIQLILMARLNFVPHVCDGAAPMAKRLRALFLKHSIISPLCLVWVRAPHWPHETSQVLLAGVPGVFSRGFSRFRHTY